MSIGMIKAHPTKNRMPRQASPPAERRRHISLRAMSTAGFNIDVGRAPGQRQRIERTHGDWEAECRPGIQVDPSCIKSCGADTSRRARPMTSVPLNAIKHPNRVEAAVTVAGGPG